MNKKSIKDFIYLLLISISILSIYFININDTQNIKICKNKNQKVLIETKLVILDIACDDNSKQKGLMFLKSLDENKGMLFMYNEPDKLKFWMKNTYIPLDIAFLNEKLEIIEIQSMEALSLKIIESKYPAKYAIEMNKDWFKNNNIKIKDKISFM